MSAKEPLRVLIVEHVPADAEPSIAVLEGAGFAVTADLAATQQEFTAHLDARRPDVVLAAYQLPGWTGMDALAILNARDPDIPLILVTGTLGEERAVECLKQGVADYLLKTNLVRLPDAVRRAIAEARTRAEQSRARGLIHKLTLAVDQSPAAIFITDTSGTIEYVNARFTEITGYLPEEVVGRNPRLLQSGTTPAETYHALWSRIREGRIWFGEIQNRRKSGELYWDAVSISPIRDAAGSVTHFLAIQEDVTERKRIEADLREREERFRQLAENISEVFFIVDASFQETLYINPAYERLWGRSRQSVYDNPLSFLDPIPEQDRVRLMDNIARARAGEDPGPLEFQLLPPGGPPRWVLSHAVPIRNDKGEVYRISGFVLDITERRRAQDALLASERRLRTLFETVKLIVLVLDTNGKVEYLNPFALQLTGYSLDEVLGHSWSERFLPESERAQLSEVFRELLEHDDSSHVRNAIVTKSGEQRMIAWHNTVVHDELGKASGTLSVGEDITEHAKLEEQYRQAQRMEAVGQLAGGVAHDFNNLLTVILSYAELLRDTLAPGDQRREDLEPIVKAAEGAAALTRQLLAFSRQQVLQPQPVQLEEAVAQSEKLLQRVIGEDVSLNTVLNVAPSTLLMDPGQLEQIIMNLAVNARDAMPRGGQLTIETGVADLDQEYARTHYPAVPGRFAVLAISDTGVGMSEATRARIFEPFFTTKQVGKGTGLGLATVYGIVKQSGGFIWVYSEPGQGATFKVYFPVVDKVSAPLIRQAQPEGTPRGSETVLLAEDATGVRAVAREILERLGYRVLEASNGRAALELASRTPGSIDLLLTDVVMPEISGKQLVDQFKLLRPETRVLYMSGHTDDAIVRHGVLEPGTSYLQKPFTPETLARKVREVLDAGRAP
jgi:two-component system cell cycle sensor histidine kinase/response regulator CckA